MILAWFLITKSQKSFPSVLSFKVGCQGKPLNALFWTPKEKPGLKQEVNLHSQDLVEFSPVQSLSCVWFFETPGTEACQVSLSIANSRSLLKFMSIELVMPPNHLILCRPLLLLPSIFPSIRVFSNESVLCISNGVSASASVFPMVDGVISDFSLPVSTTFTCFTH